MPDATCRAPRGAAPIAALTMQFDRACRRVLDRVRQEIAQHLADERRVRIHTDRAACRSRNAVPCWRRVPANSRRSCSNNGAHFEVRELQLDGARFELADIEQRIEQSRHGVDGLLLLSRISRHSSSEIIRRSAPLSRPSACNGWRRSWLAVARKRLLARLACSASRRASLSAFSTRLRSVTSRIAAATSMLPPC